MVAVAELAAAEVTIMVAVVERAAEAVCAVVVAEQVAEGVGPVIMAQRATVEVIVVA